MKHLIRKCSVCNGYTLRQLCPKCNAHTIDPHPAKYSPDDKYFRYRIADRYSQIENDRNTNSQNDS
ncbi:MAG: RNA-protein complex protein Nop10 [Thermoproteota archaeon]|nr:RNA-protein complex protein Nop10 [Thermoproteota archaeon]